MLTNNLRKNIKFTIKNIKLVKYLLQLGTTLLSYIYTGLESCTGEIKDVGGKGYFTNYTYELSSLIPPNPANPSQPAILLCFNVLPSLGKASS